MSRLHRLALWGSIAVALVLFLTGFAEARLWEASTWSPTGWRRFGAYTALFWATCGIFSFAARGWFPAALAIALVACTAYAVGVIPLLALLLFLFACAVLGRALLRNTWLVSMLAGLAVWASLMAWLANVRVHYAAVYICLLLLTIALLWRKSRDFVRHCSDTLRRRELPVPAYLAFSLFAFGATAQWLVVLAPEVSTDALAMHLTIASDMARNHAFTIDHRQILWALMPMGADYCYAVAYSLGGEYTARLLNFTMMTAAAALIYLLATKWVGRTVAWLVAAAFVCTPMTQLVTGSMFVENFVAAMLIGSLAALWRGHELGSPRDFLASAFLAGTAVGMKIGAFAFAAVVLPCIFVAILRSRSVPRKIRVAGMAAALVAFLLPGAFPYAKSYLASGNPIYPFANSVFPMPDLDGGIRDTRFNEPFDWRLPSRLTFRTSKFYEGQDGSFGFQFLLFLPLTIAASVAMRGFREMTVLLASLAGVAIIAAGQPVARYFYPFFPILSLAIAAAIGCVKVSDFRLWRVCIGLLVATCVMNFWFLPASSWYHREFFPAPLFSEQGRKDYRRSAAPVRQIIEYLNSHQTPGAVAFAQDSDIAELETPVYMNHWHNYEFHRELRRCRTPSDAYRLMVQRDVRLVVTKNARTGGVPPAFAEFLGLCSERQFAFGGYGVWKIDADCGAQLQQREAARSAVAFSPGVYDDLDERISYRGAWEPGTNFRLAYGHTITYSSESGAEVRVRFRGRSVRYGYTRAFNRGRAEISLDGQVMHVLDLFSPAVQWRAETLVSAQSEGTHELVIKVLGSKHPDSEGAFVDIDFIAVQ